jgi:hypothetical protein
MAQWMISLTDPHAPEGKQLIGFVVAVGDWPVEFRPLAMMDLPIARVEALIAGPVPEGYEVTDPRLLGRLLRTRDDVEAAGGIWPYD